jgi:hypothetical protein
MADGHPLKRAILKGEYSDEEDFWETVGASSTTCSVKLIKPNKPKQEKVPEPVVQRTLMPTTMLCPIVERINTDSVQEQTEKEPV